MKVSECTLGIVGVGNMGHALLRGLLDSQAIAPAQVRVSNRRPERSKKLASDYGVVAAESNRACAEGADVILIAVKPQIFARVLGEIQDVIGDALIISVAAGVSTESIRADLGGGLIRVVRAMPNTPALIKEGATALSAGGHATEEDMALARSILQHVGAVIEVDEGHLDAVTGLSGSGPAYVMLIIEAFCDAGVKVGLSREVAMALAVQTIQGSARLLQQTKEHPGRLKDQVTSPGGTAIAGLHTLEEGGLRTTIMNAVEAATRRARELGKGPEGSSS